MVKKPTFLCFSKIILTIFGLNKQKFFHRLTMAEILTKKRQNETIKFF